MSGYCALPFMHLTVSPEGGVRPCARFGTVHPDADDRFGTFLPESASQLSQAFHGPTMENLRARMLAGERPDECLSCHRIEEAGATSLRQASNTRFGHPTEARLTSVEVGFSNICNLKCRSCNPTNAAKLHREAGALGEEVAHDVILHSGVDFTGVDLVALRRLKFYGGEPLFHQNQIIALLVQVEAAQGSLRHLMVDIATNGTRLPGKSLSRLLDACGDVEWQFSVDAHGALNDYMRDGSRFETLTSNLSTLVATGRRVMPYTTVSVMNVNVLPLLRAWMVENHPSLYHHHFAAVAPVQIAVRHLPQMAKDILLDRLTDPSFVRARTELMLPARIAVGAISARLNAVDRLRGQFFAEVNPEMADWLGMPSRRSSAPA